ncbi:MAG: hypothetical protein ACRERC_09575 [Candidatus Binatia bacterium]
MTARDPIPESRLPVAGAVLLATGLAAIRPDWLGVLPNLVLPVGCLLLLAALLLSDRGRVATASRGWRACSIALAALVTLAAMESTVMLTADLMRGTGHTASASALLAVSGIVWSLNVVAFSLLYWELDGGGSAARAARRPPFPDLAFPQQLSPHLAPPGWRPLYVDYLYLAFTNMTAFSPTDVMPLAVWAKGLMSLQALVSLLILMLVVSRAINIMS